jgi:hypothetical protein
MHRYIDLHLHTTASDGLYTPAEILDLVRRIGLAAYSITDHDTLNGYRDAERLTRTDDPELVAGVELSILVETGDLHILAYLFDPDDERLNTALSLFQKSRNQRGRLIVEKLRNMGLHIPYELVLETAHNSVVGRPHIAEAMHKLSITRTYEEAFWKYIGKDGPAYVPKMRITPQEAIELIHDAGGIAVMAHPMLDSMFTYIEPLVALGLDGIEVYHYTAAPTNVRRLKQIAQEHGLLLSGGSDFHGRTGREESVGSHKVPAEYLERMKERALQVRGQN